MTEVLGLTAPLFLLMALGFGVVRSGLFDAAGLRVLGQFVLYVALPALIVRAFVQRPLAQMFDLSFVLAYGAASLAVFVVGGGLLRLSGQPAAAAALGALGMSCSNSGYIGYPLAAMVVGPTAAVSLAMAMLVENLLIIPLALALAEAAGAQRRGWRAVARETALRLLRSPLILSLLAGVGLSLSGAALPGPLAKAIDWLANTSAPLALCVIGGLLQFRALRRHWQPVGLIALGKLLAHPLAVWLALQVFPVADPALALSAVLVAGVPMIAIYPVLGQRFGHESLCAAALVTTVLASFFTLNLLLGVLPR